MIRKNNLLFYVIFSGLMLISLASCNPSKKYEKEEAAQIQAYLNSNPSLNFELKPSGLYYLDVETGTGPVTETHDTAYTFYTAKLLNGTVFDTNVGTDDTLVFPVNEDYLIKGFDEGITYMREGGKALFLIPSSLAYGSGGTYYIAGYTPVLFDVELVKIKPGPGKK
jgi:FKBP-type peptidyl-prolyl cis-trans isomerase FkpA